ncbi:unnamed protein product [Ceutorhynchus assimilis]|uniref:Down syndrome cell adhesion molecule-like protein Dscam2 n=1 Tax=Ceutorhynchus assimilis TaxID=467358 RepID=A0A9N9MEY0_9CUCU|nr:unnamed protein product [Ceutorhynchus assimilis]
MFDLEKTTDLHAKLYPGHVPVTGEVKRTQSTETYLHGLQKFTNYSIRVLAYTSAGDGVISDVLYCRTEEDLPGKPANIKANPLTAESILVSWLPPVKRNGHITLYTVFCREAGRVGQHKSHNVRVEDINEELALAYEVRNLHEHQLYEFWVSATTKVGDGESTPIVAQQTNSRAPSKIASFSQILRQPNKSRIMLPCVAVGNPKPRTRWIHQNKPITFSNFYAVTLDGHLHIHDVDISLTGNYTCKAVNLFGEDSITYFLIVLMPPLAPEIEIEYATSDTIKVKWSKPENGGSSIRGYLLSIRSEQTEWVKKEISPDILQYIVENLKCGSLYYIHVAAHNKAGTGVSSPIVSIRTKGGPPLLPKDDQIFATNSSVITVNLKNWPDGGCIITQFSLEYKAYADPSWRLIANSVSEDQIVIQNLLPGIWYQLKVSAQNDAGIVNGVFNVATLKIDGSRVPMLPKMIEEPIETETGTGFWNETFFVIPASILLILLIVVLFSTFAIYRRKRNTTERQDSQTENINMESQADEHHRRHRNRQDKMGERNKQRNSMQQMYLSSPVKSCDKIADVDNMAGNYEITPYATFVVPASNNSHSVKTPVDYTMQFKTFSHTEDGEHCAIIPQPTHILYRSQVHREIHEDSDSEDTSGSGREGTTAVTSSTSYRHPKQRVRDRGDRHSGVGYIGYETLLVADLYRNKDRDSSTESNDVSPLAERRQTPRHIGVKTHYGTASNSSLEHGRVLMEEEKIKPPVCFSDIRE